MAVKLYIGNLPRKLTRNELLEHFASIRNEILKVDFGIDRDGQFKGYCYIHVNNQNIAERIYSEYNHSELINCKIRIAGTFDRSNHIDSNKLAIA